MYATVVNKGHISVDIGTWYNLVGYVTININIKSRYRVLVLVHSFSCDMVICCACAGSLRISVITGYITATLLLLRYNNKRWLFYL